MWGCVNAARSSRLHDIVAARFPYAAVHMQLTSDGNLLTVKEVSERLKLSPSAVYTLCARGFIGHYRCGIRSGAIRITEKALAEYVERSKMTARVSAEG